MPRSQATGTKMGKGAARALAKNDGCVESYTRILCGSAPAGVRASASKVEEVLRDAALVLARVTRTPGCGRVEVTLQDGTTGVSVPIAGTIKMRGRASTKTDRANCMCVGDVVLLRGGIASAKVSSRSLGLIQRQLKELEIVYSTALFAPKTVAEEEDLFSSSDDEDVDVDRV